MGCGEADPGDGATGRTGCDVADPAPASVVCTESGATGRTDTELGSRGACAADVAAALQPDLGSVVEFWPAVSC